MDALPPAPQHASTSPTPLSPLPNAFVPTRQRVRRPQKSLSTPFNLDASLPGITLARPPLAHLPSLDRPIRHDPHRGIQRLPSDSHGISHLLHNTSTLLPAVTVKDAPRRAVVRGPLPLPLLTSTHKKSQPALRRPSSGTFGSIDITHAFGDSTKPELAANLFDEAFPGAPKGAGGVVDKALPFDRLAHVVKHEKRALVTPGDGNESVDEQFEDAVDYISPPLSSRALVAGFSPLEHGTIGLGILPESLSSLESSPFGGVGLEIAVEPAHKVQDIVAGSGGDDGDWEDVIEGVETELHKRSQSASGFDNLTDDEIAEYLHTISDQPSPPPATQSSSPPPPTTPQFSNGVITPAVQRRSPPRTVRKTPRSTNKPARLPSTHGIPLPGVVKNLRAKSPNATGRRVYPRPMSIDFNKSTLSVKRDQLQEPAFASPSAQEQAIYGTPDLSSLPGAFVASPVLPTSFSDYSHSPLPTPPTRFSRQRRAPVAASLTSTPSLVPTLSVVNNNNTSASSSPSQARMMSVTTVINATSFIYAASPSSMPSSPLGTPTLGTPNMFPSRVDPLNDFSTPSTPVPDSSAGPAATAMGGGAAATTATSAGATTHSGMEPALFDAAIASTIIGAIVCIGAVGWFAYALIRRRMPSKRGRRNDDDADGDGHSSFDGSEKSGRRGRIQRPPMARLSFVPPPGLGPDERTFSEQFDGWIDSEERGGRSRRSSRGGGDYSSKRSDGERRTSRSSTGSGSGGGGGRQSSRRRASLRTSTASSFAESNFSRPSTAMTSRSSHGCSVSPTPPRLPSPVGVRYSGDTFFSTTSSAIDTPTRPSKSTTAVEKEPPVPVIPLDFRTSTSTPSSPRKPRSRSSSKSSRGTKTSKTEASSASTSASSAAAREAALKKLEKRRATVDAGVLSNEVQSMLFQAELDTSSALSKLEGTSSTKTIVKLADKDVVDSDSSLDPFLTRDTKRQSLTQATTSRHPVRRISLKKKARPVTMPDLPPAIVVSDHPQKLVPPPSPARSRTTTNENEPLISSPSTPNKSSYDPHMSAKTFDSVPPWLSQSPSTTSTFAAAANVSRDDCSVMDPDMRSQKHFSADTSRYSFDTNRFSVDSTTEAIAKIVHAPLIETDIAERRLDQDEEAQHVDTDEEQVQRERRRRTLPYSVYKQRGVFIVGAPSPTSSTTIHITDSDESTTESPVRGVQRHSIVSSFPSPPTPTSPSFTNFASPSTATGNPEAFDSTFDSSLSRISRTSLDLEVEKYDLGQFRSSPVGGAATPVTPSNDKTTQQAQPLPPTPQSLMSTPSSIPPPRPTKSPTRISGHFVAPALPSPTSSRIPLPTCAAIMNGTSAAPSVAIASPSPIAPPPLRSFAAELQESVGSPPTGYDSDTLLSGYRPTRSILYSPTKSSSPSSAYRHPSSVYSSNSASIESLEEAAIARAETIHFAGGSRASGIPTYSWSGMRRGESHYDSEDSVYDESDAETARWTARMSTVSEREGY